MARFGNVRYGYAKVDNTKALVKEELGDVEEFVKKF
jgi:hypothetical protein